MDTKAGGLSNGGELVEAMWAAIDAGDVAKIFELAAKGVDVNRLERGEFGGTDTFLSEALHEKEYDSGVDIGVIQALLEAGASPNQHDNAGDMPLSLAIRLGSMEAVRLLVQFDADVNWQSGLNGTTPLMDAVAAEKPVLFKYLLSVGADPRETNADGKNLFQWARSTGRSLKPYSE